MSAQRSSGGQACVQRLLHLLMGAALMYCVLHLMSPAEWSSPAMRRPSRTLRTSADPFSPGSAEPSLRDEVPRQRLIDTSDEPADSRGPGCPARPQGLHVSNVAFGILTSDRFVQTRLQSQRLTWLQQVRDVVFYSESRIASLPTVALAPAIKEELIGSGAWKNFPALIDLHQRFPLHKYVAPSHAEAMYCDTAYR